VSKPDRNPSAPWRVLLWVVLALAIGLHTSGALAGSYVSVRQGPWGSPSTWVGGTVPGDGDVATIAHPVTVEASVTVGSGSGPAIRVGGRGTLTLSEGVTLTVRGDLVASGTVVLRAGAVLAMDTATPSVIEMTPGTTSAHLRLEGSATRRCSVRAVGAAHTWISDGGKPGGGRVVAAHCDFARLGGPPSYVGYRYWSVGFREPFKFDDCTFDQCSRIELDRDAQSGATRAIGSVEFTRCKWARSVWNPAAPGRWSIFETYSQPGMIGRLKWCDFDKLVYLKHPIGYEIEDCIFRNGITKDGSNPYEGGAWRTFRRNFMLWRTNGTSFEYGMNIEDSIIIIDKPDDNWNPHFGSISGGSGPIAFRGCIWWWPGNGDNAEGDGLVVHPATGGSRSTNIITFEQNLFLPNAKGPEGTNNLSCTGFTVGFETHDNQIRFKRNTVYTGAGIGGLNLGENATATARQVAYVKSNLFVGDVAGQGMKMNNLGGSETDVFLAKDVDYNAGYRIRSGALFGKGSAKGYGAFKFSGDDKVGVHDMDDVDPQFVDPTRNPATWAGGLQATMDRLSHTNGQSMQELLEYIREGFRPRNMKLRGAGDPDDGSPDMGAVDLVPRAKPAGDSAASAAAASSSTSPRALGAASRRSVRAQRPKMDDSPRRRTPSDSRCSRCSASARHSSVFGGAATLTLACLCLRILSRRRVRA
jgi:hypothetical protein